MITTGELSRLLTAQKYHIPRHKITQWAEIGAIPAWRDPSVERSRFNIKKTGLKEALLKLEIPEQIVLNVLAEI